MIQEKFRVVHDLLILSPSVTDALNCHPNIIKHQIYGVNISLTIYL